jgi:hypothetical protein
MVSALFPRLKLYLFGAAAFILAFFGVYFAGRRDGAKAVNADMQDQILDDIRQAREIEHEIKKMDDPAFIDRAGEWVRKGDSQ